MTDLQFAGEFELNEVKIISASGNSIDNITPLEINIYESIFSNSLTGNISVADTNNLLELLPLVGDEELILKMTTPTLQGEETSIDFTKNAFAIYNVSVNTELSAGSSVYVLEFCSPELLLNNRVRVSKAFTDTPSKIVETILTESRYINTTKKIEEEKTSGIKNIIVPNQRPFDFIRCFIQDCKSEKGSPHYLFYETTRGYNFRTLQNLYEKPTVATFSNSDPGPDEMVGNTLGIQQALNTMINFSINPPNNALDDSRGGLLGGKVITHNIFNKSYNVNSYGYFSDFDKYKRIGDNDNPKYNSNLGDWVDSRIYVHPTSVSGANLDAQYKDETNSNTNVVANKINETILYRKSRMYELNFSKTIAVTIHGTTNIAAGDMVELNYAAPGRNHNDGTLDKSISGRYLITKLRHTFSPVTSNHEINMVVTRDSLPTELPSDVDVAPTKKEGKAEVINVAT